MGRRAGVRELAQIGSCIGREFSYELLAAVSPYKGGEFEEELQRLSRNRNVLAAVIEAALGALFLQHGFAAIEDAVVGAFSEQIEQALTTRVDQKTDLQELLARSGRHVTYVEISVEGPPHERRFTCAAVIDGEELGRGEGRTKKAAEQEAAREALAKLDAAEL